MGLQIHTPEEKDKMVEEIDTLRFKKKPNLTLPQACEVVGKKMGKKAGSVKSLYNYWKAVKAEKSYLSNKNKRPPTQERVASIATAIKTAIDQQGGSMDARRKPTRGNGSDPRAERREMLKQSLNLVQRITEELLNEEEGEARSGSDHETES